MLTPPPPWPLDRFNTCPAVPTGNSNPYKLAGVLMLKHSPWKRRGAGLALALLQRVQDAPPSPSSSRGELSHARPAAAHALVGPGECATIIEFGVMRRGCRVSPPPPPWSSACCCRELKAPRQGLGAAWLPPSTVWAARTAWPAGRTAVGSAGHRSRASGPPRRAAGCAWLQLGERWTALGRLAVVLTFVCAGVVWFLAVGPSQDMCPRRRYP